ncbi:hypothetical protein GWI33_021714 [Rhynchophorus ferrugineus]|uniref:Deacetylase sirtuin-type domain-containing protein n=1 Tax=Rhynchophorus ferrugineus TaxID=354439 RepID=A0A834MJG9_RHYFE|nr:hypothetical protein GWI33_021714 [Rhynchophorus ferrugineus]
MNNFVKHVRHFSINSKGYSISLEQFVPKHKPARDEDIQLLENFIFNSKRLLVLTGAGISTESGIPDYRSEVVGLYARTNHKPIQHMEFMRSNATRQRYWARNFVGWPRFSKSQPNAVHFSIKKLEIDHKIVHTVVTQNVDNLHYKAGSQNVIELHGNGHRVVCLQCNKIYDRYYIQEKLKNKYDIDFDAMTKVIGTDGDVAVPEEFSANFTVPTCESCNGILKPDITFFGANVPKSKVDKVKENVTMSDSLLVLGSSLSVFSGYRIFLQALEEGKNTCIVNIGRTRADDQVKLKIEAKCGDILPKIC